MLRIRVASLFPLALNLALFGQTSKPVAVSPESASTMVVQKSPVQYPAAARAVGTQGTVLLRVVVGQSGDVKEVTTISGNPVLAQAAADAIKQWKYRPYMVDGVPAEMETQVSISFHLKITEPRAAPDGHFRDGAYYSSLGFAYPLSRDWVRETQIMQERFAAEGAHPGDYVLLASVHIPQSNSSTTADSSFVLWALARNHVGSQSCEQYFSGLADLLRKGARSKDDPTKFSVADREFYRVDFDFRAEPHRRAFICTEFNDYLLRWNIGAKSNEAVNAVVGTISAVHAVAPEAIPASEEIAATQSSQPLRVRISQGVTQGMLLKRVQPIYPEIARANRLEGTVVLKAVIDANGDIAELEAIQGPIEFVVSAVNGVRQWKYRPYVIQGKPVEVATQITVNYTLRP